MLNRTRARQQYSSSSRNHGFPGYHRLMSVLSRADSIRSQIERLNAELREILRNPATLSDDDDEECLTPMQQAKLKAAWDQFIRDGGVTRLDLERWLAGQPIGRRRKVKTRKHLRLVSERRAGSIPRLPRYQPKRWVDEYDDCDDDYDDHDEAV